MNLQRTLPLALVLAAPAFAQDQDKPKHLLRFNFKAGTVAEQVLTQDMTMTMQMGVEDLDLEITADDLKLKVRFGFTRAQLTDHEASDAPR